MDKRTQGYFAVTKFEPGYETQHDATEAGREFVGKDPSQHVDIIYVQLVHTITPETEIKKIGVVEGSPFQLTTKGHIDNGPPALTPQANAQRYSQAMLEQAAKLLNDTQLELKACRGRIGEQEAELRELREELSRPEGE